MKILFLHFYLKRLFLVVIFVVVFYPTLVLANPIQELYVTATDAYIKNDFGKAIEYYEKTNAMYPGLPQSHHYLGLAKKAMGYSTEEVLASLNKAIELNPDYAECYDNIAKVYYSMADFETSAEYSRKAIEINPDFVSARLSLGWTYLLGLNEPALAAEQFSQVSDSHNIAIAHFGLGLAYFIGDEKFRVLEMITSLRQLGENEYAQQLEDMLNRGSFIAPRINGVPLIAPQAKQGVLVEDIVELQQGLVFSPEQKAREKISRDGQMKVRLVDPFLQETQAIQDHNRESQGRGLSF